MITEEGKEERIRLRKEETGTREGNEEEKEKGGKKGEEKTFYNIRS